MIGIVGCGTSGILVILELIRQGISPKQIVVIDPYFDGGSLLRKWGSIQSNTRWDQIRDCMIHYSSANEPIEALNQKYTAEQTVLLSDLGWLLHQAILPYLSHIQTHIECCTTVFYENSKPVLQIEDQSILCDLVFFCQGGKQKTVDCGKPTIPIEIALDPVLLKRYIKPGQIVSVFGTAHSGTLVMKHLLECGANVIGFHKSSSPFLFARDGHYDGIKQESEEIADRILAKKYENIQLFSTQNLKNIIQSVSKSAWIVSCSGFDISPIQLKDENGSLVDSSKYSPQTGQIYKSIYGFGLAYPGVTEMNTKIYKDISIPSFVQQIQRCLPEILKNNQS
jgi:hypothetical protein